MTSVVSLVVTARNQTQGAFASLNRQIQSGSQASRRATQQMQRDYSQAQRSVNGLRQQLQAAQVAEYGVAHTANQARQEMDRLDRAVNSLGSAAPQQLRDRLAAAQTAAAHAANSLDRAHDNTQQLARSLQHATNNAQQLDRALYRARMAQGSLLGQMMTRIGAANTSGILGPIKAAWAALPTQVKGVVIAVGAALAVTLAAAVGAMLGALLTMAVGAAFLGLGAVVATKTSAAVRNAFKDVFSNIKKDVTDFSRVFDEPLIASAKIFGDAWAAVKNDVSAIFKELAQNIEPLANGLKGMAEKAMPGLRQAAAAAGPLLREFAKWLPEIGKAIGDFFGTVSKGRGNLEGLRLLMGLLVGTVQFLGNTIRFLSDGFDNLTQSAIKVTSALSHLPLVGGIFADAHRQLEVFHNDTEGVVRPLHAIADAGAVAGAGLGSVADAASDASDRIRTLSDTMFGLIDAQLALDRANSKFAKNLRELTDGFKANGTSINEATVAGEKNVENMRQVIEGAAAARKAQIDLAGGNNASGAAVQAANAKFRQQIDALRDTMTQAGMTRDQINSILGPYYALLGMPNISKSITITTYENRQMGSTVTKLPGGGVSVRKNNFYASGGIVSAAAGGGARGGLTLVGERGAELVQLPQGSKVYPNSNTRQMMSGGAGSGTVKVELVATGGGRGTDWLEGAIRDALYAGRLRLQVVNGVVTNG